MKFLQLAIAMLFGVSVGAFFWQPLSALQGVAMWLYAAFLLCCAAVILAYAGLVAYDIYQTRVATDKEMELESHR